MGRFRQSFTVSASPSAAVDYLADYAHTVAWDPGTTRCTRDDIGPLGVGTTWTNVSDFRGRETTLTYRLVELTDRRIRFEGEGRGATAYDDFTVTAGAGATAHITYDAGITFKTWRKVADPFLRPMLSRMGAGAVAGVTAALAG
ncbi:MAG TPA: SRPBCC family protein [Mycobacteriales bacterium]